MTQETKIEFENNWQFVSKVSNYTDLYIHKKHICPDGDGIELFINKYSSGRFIDFELFLFSGIPASHIYFDVVDLESWIKRFNIDRSDELQMVFQLADKFVELFYGENKN